MKEILIIVFSGIFTIISFFHFYWGFGGKFGSSSVIPTKNDSDLTFKPGKIATILVAFVFLAVALFPLIESKWINIQLPEILINYGYWFLGAVLILRSIGEFKYVRLFKKVKNTAFAKNDTKYYTPLCLSLVIIITLILFKQ
jgi:hypothetical protein